MLNVSKNIILFLDTHFQNVSGNLMQISFWEVKVEAVFTNRFYLNMPFTTFHHSKYTLINGFAHARKTWGPQHMPTEGLFVCLLEILSDSLTWQKPLKNNSLHNIKHNKLTLLRSAHARKT